MESTKASRAKIKLALVLGLGSISIVLLFILSLTTGVMDISFCLLYTSDAADE